MKKSNCCDALAPEHFDRKTNTGRCPKCFEGCEFIEENPAIAEFRSDYFSRMNDIFNPESE